MAIKDAKYRWMYHTDSNKYARMIAMLLLPHTAAAGKNEIVQFGVHEPRFTKVNGKPGTIHVSTIQLSTGKDDLPDEQLPYVEVQETVSAGQILLKQLDLAQLTVMSYVPDKKKAGVYRVEYSAAPGGFSELANVAQEIYPKLSERLFGSI